MSKLAFELDEAALEIILYTLKSLI